MEIDVLFPYIDRLRLQMPLQSITMDHLAAKSGISRATLYRNFGSKKQILTSYLQKNGEMHLSESMPDISERILTAAETVFLTYGFSASTVEMIAEEAGLGTATIYRYFENKENLIIQVLHHLSPTDNRIFDEINLAQEFESAMMEYTRTALRYIRTYRSIYKLIIFESEYLSPISQQINNTRESTREKLVNFFLHYLPESPYKQKQAQIIALSFIGLIFGFSFSNVLMETYVYDEEQAVTWVSEMMIKKVGELSV